MGASCFVPMFITYTTIPSIIGDAAQNFQLKYQQDVYHSVPSAITLLRLTINMDFRLFNGYEASTLLPDLHFLTIYSTLFYFGGDQPMTKVLLAKLLI